MFPTYSGFNFDSDEVPPVLRHSQASGHLLQLIPRHCSQLETLDLHLQEMEIGEIEMSEWACKNLRTLRIRIKGLDTKDKILKTIALWRAGCWRHWQKATGDPGSVDEQGKSNQSIEARVARHLLKFDKLGKVWLGTQPMDTATTKNPFDIPELRHRLSLFVTVKNALSCARVSKSWVYDFVAAVWFTVHFDVHPRFVDLASEIITKHCHFIRIVKNVKSLLHVRSIANTGVNRLRELRMNTAASAMQHVYGHEIVSRNSARLENPDTLSTSIPANKRNSTVHYLSASALIPFPCSTSKATTSKLKVLKLSSMWLTLRRSGSDPSSVPRVV
ncbi:hypothetical protein BGX23_011583 [Mortierella sp. AD031]|nr:hypothetical protein BGX23_011583 [Mortierella sp. AD031]